MGTLLFAIARFGMKPAPGAVFPFPESVCTGTHRADDSVRKTVSQSSPSGKAVKVAGMRHETRLVENGGRKRSRV